MIIQETSAKGIGKSLIPFGFIRPYQNTTVLYF